MTRLKEILTYLSRFVIEKLNCKVILEIVFHEGGVRNCKTKVEKNLEFKE